MRNSLRGAIGTALIAAGMIAGILAAAKAAATPEQDYEYFALLEHEGLTITSRPKAKQTATTICRQLDAGTPWQAVINDLMAGGNWDLDTAATVFAVGVTIYCPHLAPDLESDLA